MKKIKLDYFQTLFLQKRDQIIQSSTPEAVVPDGGDETDKIQSAIINGLSEAIILRDKNTLKKLNQALKRIEDGTFGTCEDCEEAIGEARLHAIPDANLCIHCMEKQEREAKQYRK